MHVQQISDRSCSLLQATPVDATQSRHLLRPRFDTPGAPVSRAQLCSAVPVSCPQAERDGAVSASRCGTRRARYEYLHPLACAGSAAKLPLLPSPPTPANPPHGTQPSPTTAPGSRLPRGRDTASVMASARGISSWQCLTALSHGRAMPHSTAWLCSITPPCSTTTSRHGLRHSKGGGEGGGSGVVEMGAPAPPCSGEEPN